jgi:hypothetical protein
MSHQSNFRSGSQSQLQATVEDLKQAIFDDRNRSGAFAPVRQRLTLPAEPGTRSGQPLPPNKTLCELGFAEDVVVIHKDLGTQVRCTISIISFHILFLPPRWGVTLVLALYPPQHHQTCGILSTCAYYESISSQLCCGINHFFIYFGFLPHL